MVFERKGFARELARNCNVGARRIQFAGWALTEGQHRPKAGKKKKTREAGLFFLVPVRHIYLSSILHWIHSTEASASPGHAQATCPNASMCSEPCDARIARAPIPCRQECLACRVVSRIALQAGHASPVKWCLKEKVLLGKWSAIASGVWMKR